jgi:hypothetical protein
MKSKKIEFKINATLIALLIGAFVLCSKSFDKPSPNTITRTYLAVIKDRIKEFNQKNNSIPETLNEIKRNNDPYNFGKDGWGNEIIYKANNNNQITLISLGKDSKIGGDNENADLIETFMIENAILEKINENLKTEEIQ